MANRIIHSTPEQVDQRRKDIAARCITAKVTGALPIRDAVDREDRVQGQIVRLDPQDMANPQPGRTLIAALVASGAIELGAPEATPEA